MAVETAINAMSLIFEVAPVLISAGMVSANNSTSGPEAHPTVGGNGRSRQSGNWVLDQSTRWPSMSRDHAGKLQKTQTHFANMPAQLGFRLEERAF